MCAVHLRPTCGGKPQDVCHEEGGYVFANINILLLSKYNIIYFLLSQLLTLNFLPMLTKYPVHYIKLAVCYMNFENQEVFFMFVTVPPP